MRIVVLGGGITGITGAHALIEDGHEVIVVDRRDAPALETSFANAGQLSFGFASPWAAPGIPMRALSWTLERDAPLILSARFDPAMWSWLIKFVRNCTAKNYQRNKKRLLKLAQYSQRCLHDILRDVPIAFDHQKRGILDLYRDEAALEKARTDQKVLERFGIDCQVLDRERCLAIEPALAATHDKIAGALHIAHDETGDCRLFAHALAERVKQNARASFRFGTEITAIKAKNGRIEYIEVDDGFLKADAYVVSLGSYSPAFLKPLGIALPVYPVKGYSATLSVIDEAAAPRGTLTDEKHKVAMTRLGGRLRLAGFAELAGHDLSIPERRLQALINVAKEWFPEAADYTRFDPWTGLRPMTPDGAPAIGPTRIDNLFLNTGHGTLGWTLSCASARVLADVIANRRPA
ncbi:MAG: D-amino acid dehydrogenase, partial [Rhodospirillales bacterium]